jgi:two-component system phosphate regulon response regulator PhoB
LNKILIADDDPGVRELCRIVLKNEGFEVVEAENATDCVTLAGETLPDLILLDWMMPDIDGMDALRMLKADTHTRSIPVVMLTALDGLTQITLATFTGAEGYVTKPFDVSDLLSLVRRFTQVPAPAH